MSQSTGVHIEEIDTPGVSKDRDESGSDSEDHDAQPTASGSTPVAGSSKKSKKKKKSKTAKALSQLTGKGRGNEIPQAIVDHVMQDVHAKHGADAQGADEESIRRTLEQLKLMDVLKGKTGIGGKNKKEMGEYKVSWQECPFTISLTRCFVVLANSARTANGFVALSI